MSNDTDWIQPGVQAVVTLATAENSGEVMIDGCERWIPQSALRPLPPPLSPTAQRVAEAAMMEHQKSYYDSDGKNNSFGEWAVARDNLRSACREHAEHLATLRPADPLAVAMERLKEIADWIPDRDVPKFARDAIREIETLVKGNG